MTETTTAGMRRCIGSAKFGIESHDAPIEDFPKQPSQKDGLGRMCRPHWNAYTTALRKAALERKTAEPAEADAPADESADEETPAAESTEGDAAADVPEPKRRRRAAKAEATQEPTPA